MRKSRVDQRGVGKWRLDRSAVTKSGNVVNTYII